MPRSGEQKKKERGGGNPGRDRERPTAKTKRSASVIQTWRTRTNMPKKGKQVKAGTTRGWAIKQSGWGHNRGAGGVLRLWSFRPPEDIRGTITYAEPNGGVPLFAT